MWYSISKLTKVLKSVGNQYVSIQKKEITVGTDSNILDGLFM